MKNFLPKEIFDNISLDISYATLKRILTKLKTENKLETLGKRFEFAVNTYF